jgi:hypothetical protein
VEIRGKAGGVINIFSICEEFTMLKNWMWLLLLTFSISPAMVGCSTDAGRTDPAVGEGEPEEELTEEDEAGEE